MKNRRYVNYGAISINEYSKAKIILQTPEHLDTRNTPVRRARRPGPSGWDHSHKSNGWRADAASCQDEQAD